VLVVVPLVLAAGLLSATYAWCCPTANGDETALPRVVEAGLPDLFTVDHGAAVARTGGDLMVRSWTEDRGANARVKALVGMLAALAALGAGAGPASFLVRRGRFSVVRRRHSISLRAPPRLRLTL
jgi:hypothetical protein